MALKQLLWTFLGLFPLLLSGQEIVTDTTAKKQEVEIDHADVFTYERTALGDYQKLIGHVELSQDSLYMYCDSALLIQPNQVIANGHVIIQQNDTVSVFSDSLYYNGNERVADLFGEVILVNGEQKLFTNQLRYDFNTKIATYTTGATLVDNGAQLTSKRGYYYVGENMAFFKDSVIVVDSTFLLKADTLIFNTKTEVVDFAGPTLLKNDTIRVYCESGFYDTQHNLAEFRKRAQFEKGKQQATAETIRYNGAANTYELVGQAQFVEAEKYATADTIRYDERTDQTFLIGSAFYREGDQEVTAKDQIVYDSKSEGFSTTGRSIVYNPPQILEADNMDYNEAAQIGVAEGNVIWRDTSADLSIYCATAHYNRETDYLKAFGGIYGRPYMASVIEMDTLFMSADTLLSIQLDTMTQDSSRALIGFHDVRVYKSNLQAVCDSLVYMSADSMFHFFTKPMMWSDTSQFSADTIRMRLRDQQIHKIYLSDNAFIVNSPDELFFNQIKGRYITASFEDQELRLMHVEGNAESVYYVLDEEQAYVGVNKTICSEMKLFFGDNQVDQIRFYDESQASLIPMRQADHKALELDGFQWERKRRPTRFEDLFDLPIIIDKADTIQMLENSTPLSGSPPPPNFSSEK